MNFIALLHMGVLLAAWFGGILSIPVACILYFTLNDTTCALLLVLYFGFRLIWPRRRWKTLHRFASRLAAKHQYFRTQRTVLECTLPSPNSRALFVFHPHGITCSGYTVNGVMCQDMLQSDITYVVSELLMHLPMVSDLISWHGAGGSSKRTFRSLMESNANIALIPGGFEEATLFEHDHHRVYLKFRKGFIKYALRFGYDLYPAYTFGEEKTFFSVQRMQKFRIWLNKWSIPGVIFWSRIGCFPETNVDLITVIGKPLNLPRIVNPSETEVDNYHKMYINCLTELFERNSKLYAADPSRSLEII